MVGFIDAHRDAHGVDPICSMLPIAPSTYYEHLAKRGDPCRLSDRARRREGLDVARCTVARLMRDMAIQGIIRGKPHRQFRVPAPNMLWVSDFT